MIREVGILQNEHSWSHEVIITTVDFEELRVFFSDSADAKSLSDLLQKATDVVVVTVRD